MKKIWNVIKAEFIKTFTLKNIIIIFLCMLVSCIVFQKISTPQLKTGKLNLDLKISTEQKRYNDIKEQLDKEYNENSYLSSLEIKNRIDCLKLLKEEKVPDADNWKYLLVSDIEIIRNKIDKLEFYHESNEKVEELKKQEEKLLNFLYHGYRYQFIADYIPTSLEHIKKYEELLKTTTDTNEKWNIEFLYITEQKNYELEKLLNDLAIKNENDWRYKEEASLLNYIYDSYQPIMSEEEFYGTNGLISEYDNYKNYHTYISRHQEESRKQMELSFYSLRNNIPLDRVGAVDYKYNYYTAKNVTNNIFYGAFIIMIISCILNGGIISEEHSKGTIRMLASKPVKRWKILFGKFAAMNLISIILYISLFVILLIYSGLTMGFSGLLDPKLLYISGKVCECSYIFWLLKNIVLCIVPLIMINTLTLLLSTFSLNTSLTVGIMVIISTISTRVLTLIDSLNMGTLLKYTPFPYLNLEDYIFNTNLYQKNVDINILGIGPSLILMLVYIFILVFIIFFNYLKKDIRN